MSKIGRRPISIGSVAVDINGQTINYKGSLDSGAYNLPEGLTARLEEKTLTIVPVAEMSPALKRDINRIWGLHRALLFNKIKGAHELFERHIDINGLGYKAVANGSTIVFSLGFSHKIDFPLPKNVTFESDRTGQKLTFRSFDKELLGRVCSDVRALRAPEPYKGTGIKYREETIARKAGKTKA